MSDVTRTVFAAALIALAVACHAGLSTLAPKLGLRKPNFKKKLIPSSYGICLACYAIAGCGIAAVFGRPEGLKLYLPVIFIMTSLGFADDVFGSRDVGGFTGHFKKLLLEGRVTTGAVKAIGGGVTALLAGLAVSGWKVPEGILNGAVIALSANTLNLLDLRPGRAAGVFFMGVAAAFAASGFSLDVPWPVVAVIIPAAGFYLRDARALAMMGDSGSNMLGAVMGLMFVVETSVAVRCFWLAVVVVIHIYSEKHSISQLIESNTVLRWVDRRLGER